MEATSRLHQGDRAASIGPRPRGRGNSEGSRIRRALLLASIGPRPRGRGNSKHALARMVDEGASIGPRPRGRGNLAAAGKVAPNEKLQLGLDLAVEETMGCRLTPRPPSPRFNWASTSRSRKPAMVEPGATVDLWLQLGLDLAVEETPAG